MTKTRPESKETMQQKQLSVIVLDIGGTNIRTGLLNQASKPVLVSKTPKHRDEILPGLIREIDQIIQQKKLSQFRIVVGCPGLISMEGDIDAALYWPASGIGLGQELRRKYSCGVFVINDANLQAYAVAAEIKNALYLTFGTGVGGAVIVNHSVVLGARGYAGEFGHIVCASKERRCKCGLFGCLDTVASGFWLRERLGDMWWRNENDPRVIAALSEAGAATASALGPAATLLDVQKVVLAGYIVSQSEFKTSLLQVLIDMSFDVELEYRTDTWPLVMAGASHLVKQIGVF